MADSGLAPRLAALTEAVEACEGRLDESALADAKRVSQRATQRLELSGDHTVVALGGATGSGKSTLFNALTGTQLAQTGVRRPTTSTAMAAGWGSELPHKLLDWLDVPRRHLIPSGSSGLENLVLIDLPDHDSTEVSHRLTVDRLVPLVDMLVWVVDPQKYADAALHDTYLKPLAPYASSMVVVLNQADRLWGDELDRCLSDLRKLLDSEGLRATPILAVSALEGTNVKALRDLIASVVADKKAALVRTATDVRVAADGLAKALNAGKPRLKVGDGDRGALIAAMADMAGAGVVAESAEKSWRRKGTIATGWPFVAWLQALRPDPLRSLRITKGENDQTLGEVARTSIPPASASQKAAVDTALRTLVNHSSEGLPRGWADAIKTAARGNEKLVADKFDEAIATAGIGEAGHRTWWTIVTLFQWLLMIAVIGGVVWWLINPVLVLVGLPMLPGVSLRGVPVSWLLIIGGILGGLLLGLISRAFVDAGASRRARRVRELVTQRVGSVADTEIIAPIQAELDRYRRAVDAVKRAA